MEGRQVSKSGAVSRWSLRQLRRLASQGDKLGTLWAFSDGYGFFSSDHYRWKAWATPPEVAKQRVADMFSDSTGLIWVSTYEGDIITMDKGNVVDYPLNPDSPVRYVPAFAEHAPQEIWAGGAGGLVLINKGHFRVIRPAALDSWEMLRELSMQGATGFGSIRQVASFTCPAMRQTGLCRIPLIAFRGSDSIPSMAFRDRPRL